MLDSISNWTRRYLQAYFLEYSNDWSFQPGSASQGGCWPYWIRPMTSSGWTVEYYSEININGKKFGTGILCVLRFKTVWEFIQCCLTSKRNKGFGPTDLRILNLEKILRWVEIMRNMLYNGSFISQTRNTSCIYLC